MNLNEVLDLFDFDPVRDGVPLAFFVWDLFRAKKATEANVGAAADKEGGKTETHKKSLWKKLGTNKHFQRLITWALRSGGSIALGHVAAALKVLLN